jgi:hypothetical protein
MDFDCGWRAGRAHKTTPSEHTYRTHRREDPDSGRGGADGRHDIDLTGEDTKKKPTKSHADAKVEESAYRLGCSTADLLGEKFLEIGARWEQRGVLGGWGMRLLLAGLRFLGENPTRQRGEQSTRSLVYGDGWSLPWDEKTLTVGLDIDGVDGGGGFPVHGVAFRPRAG